MWQAAKSASASKRSTKTHQWYCDALRLAMSAEGGQTKIVYFCSSLCTVKDIPCGSGVK